ncbi:MAG TPA: hypothetical protein ENK56_09035 [Chloroflexi bacterium]|nr:hypothetical protein [Chloroflexota bacterium]
MVAWSGGQVVGWSLGHLVACPLPLAPCRLVGGLPWSGGRLPLAACSLPLGPCPLRRRRDDATIFYTADSGSDTPTRGGRLWAGRTSGASTCWPASRRSGPAGCWETRPSGSRSGCRESSSS